jgi:hypothetical protein
MSSILKYLELTPLRQLGADAMVVLTPVGQRNYDALGIPEEIHRIFRADAIVFDLEK